MTSLKSFAHSRQLAVIRSMSLNQTAHDPPTISGTAQVESEAHAVLKDVGVAGLNARPLIWIELISPVSLRQVLKSNRKGLLGSIRLRPFLFLTYRQKQNRRH